MNINTEMSPEISLIICTRNRDHVISDTLNSALSQSLDTSRYEVLVMDQSTNDETEKLLKDYSNFRYFRLNSRGLSISRNEGLKQSRGEIIVFADDDLLFEENYLSDIVDFFSNSEFKPDMIGGKILPKYLAPKPDWIEGYLLGGLGYSDYGDKPRLYDSHPKHVPYGGNMAIKRKCLNKVGSFSIIKNADQSLTVENEDIIFANKLRELGYTLAYCPDMVVYHKIQPDFLTYKYYKKRYYLQGISDAKAYYMLEMFSYSEITIKIIIHIKRLFTGLIFQFFKKTPYEKYYQNLRVYYNAGYIKSLLKILFDKKI
ncbi:MAG: glycosyltransferase [Candidatus Gastranaerophilales bacterium]|nr:glycosyltransferase [Candidatus Gastranaerophilales bacterium]